MSEEKTEEATPRQIEKAREKGDVSKSQDMTAAALLGVAVLVFAFAGAAAGETFKAILRNAFETAARDDLSPGMLITSLGKLFVEGMGAFAALFIMLFFVAGVIVYVQVGPLFTMKPLAPKLDKLNAIKGLKNIFFTMQTYVELAKSSVKIGVIIVITWQVVKAELGTIVMLGTLPLEQAVGIAVGIVARCVAFILLFFVVVAVLDLFYQRWNYKRKLRMSKDQVKREFKEQEGDPEHKQQRKELHQEISENQMVAAVENADVIVTNPDHIACALRYDPEKEGAPRLVAKGGGYLAERIKKIAKEKGIPVIRNVSLARALNELKLETEIPEELYDAVAELLKWVELVAASHGETPRWVQSGGDDEGEDEAE